MFGLLLLRVNPAKPFDDTTYPNDAGTILVNGIDEVAVEAVGVAGNMPVMDKLPGFMVEEVEPSPVGADP